MDRKNRFGYLRGTLSPEQIQAELTIPKRELPFVAQMNQIYQSPESPQIPQADPTQLQLRRLLRGT